MKRILVNGAGGFIPGHMAKCLRTEENWVRTVDLKRREYVSPPADELIVGELRNQMPAADVVKGVDELCQFAADMGYAGYIFAGEHDARRTGIQLLAPHTVNIENSTKQPNDRTTGARCQARSCESFVLDVLGLNGVSLALTFTWSLSFPRLKGQLHV
jgi:hypothetical protein